MHICQFVSIVNSDVNDIDKQGTMDLHGPLYQSELYMIPLMKM
jgi:hypothetical protein